MSSSRYFKRIFPVLVRRRNESRRHSACPCHELAHPDQLQVQGERRVCFNAVNAAIRNSGIDGGGNIPGKEDDDVTGSS